MNVYVETNFVLELTFQQEEFESCEQILQRCEAKGIQIVIPAYSLAEPHEKLIRQAKNRIEIHRKLHYELEQLKRTESYNSRISNIEEDISYLLLRSSGEEKQRFAQYRERLLKSADIISLTAAILSEAANYEVYYGLEPQDAIVYASVISHLRQYQPQVSCFLNRNTKDFNNHDIVNELNQFNCRMIWKFDQGYNFIQSQLSS